MPTLVETIPEATGPSAGEAARTQVRGSSLLLVGRFLSLAINFASQVLIVRYLTTSDYGAVAYSLSIAASCQPFATLGLQEAISRFVPIYHENRQYDRLLGTILLLIVTALLTSLAIIGVVLGFPNLVSRFMTDDQVALHLLSILILLVPLEALEGLFVGIFASFASSGAIFFLRHLLGPSLKLAVVFWLVLLRSGVTFLAYGYLLASLVGVLVNGWMLERFLRREHLLGHAQRRKLKVPAREVFAFSLPGLTASFVTVAIYSVNASLLGYWRDVSEVAFYRAVVPLAQLNNIVMTSFAFLYMPLAARLYARSDYSGINGLYWKTAVWMSVLSFPIFAMTFSIARPLTILVYGARYEGAAPILALLALGVYFNSLLGFNLQTLKVVGRLRYIVVASLAAGAANLLLDAVLIPRSGALGAAIGTVGTLILFNLLLQAGLIATPGFSFLDRQCRSAYLTIALSAAALFGIQFLSSSSAGLAVVLASIASLFVLAMCRKNLDLTKNFPEFTKIPFMRMIFT